MVLASREFGTHHVLGTSRRRWRHCFSSTAEVSGSRWSPRGGGWRMENSGAQEDLGLEKRVRPTKVECPNPSVDLGQWMGDWRHKGRLGPDARAGRHSRRNAHFTIVHMNPIGTYVRSPVTNAATSSGAANRGVCRVRWIRGVGCCRGFESSSPGRTGVLGLEVAGETTSRRRSQT